MMNHTVFSVAVAFVAATLATAASAQQNPPKGVYSFGADQTIADISKMEWGPLKLDGLPPGIEIAVLRGDLAKGGGEILLRTPPKYVVPNHSHTSDEMYVWLKGRVHIRRSGRDAAEDGSSSLYKPSWAIAACT